MFPAGTFRMAVQLGIPMLVLFIMKDCGTRYRGFIYPLTADRSLPAREQAGQLALQFAEKMETVLRRYPNQWFNYFDFWKINNVNN